MANIYNFLNNVYLKVKNQVANNTFVVLLTLVFFTIPLPYIFNSIATISFALFCVYNLKSHKLVITKEMLVPTILYLLMVISLLWTIDFNLTSAALIKEIPFLIVPICFCIVPIVKGQRDQIILNFGYVIFVYTIFYLLKAFVRFIISKDSSVFFYHELVTDDVNAIHVSVYSALAFFVFLIKKDKSILDRVAIVIIGFFIFLLSSKNIIVTFVLLLLIYFVFYTKRKFKKAEIILALFSFILVLLVFFNKAKERFLIEFESNSQEVSMNKEKESNGMVFNVSIRDAWKKDKFTYNDYFPGTAMRVYQIRIFKELLQEDTMLFTGYGLNASGEKVNEKRIEHNLYPGYEKLNFHNQYIQFFAELGVFGLLLLVIILVKNIKNAINNKDFIHFSFGILMISLFLTESFLSRQRGIVFFVMMYCVFNARVKVFNSKS